MENTKEIWYIGSIDGKHYIVSTDRYAFPINCNPAPLHRRPTDKDLENLRRDGCTVEFR